MATVPGNWNAEARRYNGSGPETYGCYRFVCQNLEPTAVYALLTKESPGTSCALYINRQLVAQTGDPFAMVQPDFNEKANAYNPSHSQSKPLFCEFYPNEKGEVEIIFFISNYYYINGGLWDSVFFGRTRNVLHTNNLTLLFNTFVIGCLFFIGLLNIIHFLINKKSGNIFIWELLPLFLLYESVLQITVHSPLFFLAYLQKLKSKLHIWFCGLRQFQFCSSCYAGLHVHRNCSGFIIIYFKSL